MAEGLSRLKKSRAAQRNVAKGLIVKAQNLMKEGPGEGSDDDVRAMLQLIKGKEDAIAQINQKVLEVIEENDIETDVEECTDFELKLTIDVTAIQDYMERKNKLKDAATVPKPERNVESHDKIGVKLQKINIKKFSGDPVAWQQFEEIFTATVHKNQSLSAIEKFSYLKGYLMGPAEKCIDGLPLTNENYQEAFTLLRERFGNPQLIIASHMHNLLKIDKVTVGKYSRNLRNLYDQVEVTSGR